MRIPIYQKEKNVLVVLVESFHHIQDIPKFDREIQLDDIRHQENAKL